LNALKAIQEHLGSGNQKVVELKHQFLLTQFQETHRELVKLKNKIRFARMDIVNPGGIPADLMEEYLEKDPGVIAARQAVLKAKTQRDDYKKAFKDAEHRREYLDTVEVVERLEKTVEKKRDEARIEAEKKYLGMVEGEKKRNALNVKAELEEMKVLE